MRLNPADVNELQSAIEKDPRAQIAIDVSAREVTATSGSGAVLRYAAAIPDGARRGLLTGHWDATGLLLEDRDAIERVVRSLPYARGFAL